ncbi:MAG: DsbA family protein [Bacteroidia bacterium]
MNAKPQIIYVFDPMCGWCYGFSNTIKEAEQKYSADFDFKIISGGMVLGEREGPIGEFANYILSAYPKVEEYSGMKFGQPYIDQLKTQSLYTSSLLPSIALCIVQQMDSTKAIQFASAMQKAHFQNGKNLSDSASYEPILMDLGLDKNHFFLQLQSGSFLEEAQKGFAASHYLGVNGYPAVLALVNGKYYSVAKGFIDKESFFQILDRVKTIQ